MSDSELDSEDEEIKISKTYKTTALNSFSTVVLAMLTSGTIVSVLNWIKLLSNYDLVSKSLLKFTFYAIRTLIAVMKNAQTMPTVSESILIRSPSSFVSVNQVGCPRSKKIDFAV